MHYYIDIVDACNKKCPACWRGSRVMKNTGQKMDFDLFKPILDKIVSIISPTPNIVCLFNWTEPFLHPDTTLFIEECKKRGLRSTISSNFALKNIKDSIQGAINAGLTKLIVSVSGYTDDVYGEYHRKGSGIDVVLGNLEFLSTVISENPSTIVDVHYISFPYNQHEIEDFRRFCNDHKLNFIVKKGTGYNSTAGQWNNLLEPSFSEKPLTLTSDWKSEVKPCAQIFDMCSIDYRGDLYLCCAFPYLPNMRIGSFLEMDVADILLQRVTHPACQKCPIPRRDWTTTDIAAMQDALMSKADCLLDA
jgi:MoaA/NifB/PqqE/SkfB family radical SAM enzyme